MKRIVMVVLLVQLVAVTNAQTFDEWFRQQKTQIQYLVNQVAALQVYIDLAQKGYSIYQDGLTFIGDIKDGDVNLHRKYFGSLSAINPHISHSPQVAEILAMDQAIQIFHTRVAKLELAAYSGSIRRLFDAIANKSSGIVAQLQLLLSDSGYQLKDAERVHQIDQLHAAMSTLYGFAKSSYENAVMQSKVLPREDKEIGIIKRWEGVK